MRESLEDSLLDNLIYNERRQQDIIKLFEISDLYSISKNEIKKKRNLGVIGSVELTEILEISIKKLINLILIIFLVNTLKILITI